MGTISRHFSYREFEHSEYADRHDLCNVIRSYRVRDSIKALVDEVLEPLREAWGAPLSISSGYRCPEVNAGVGGVPTSQHVLGEAADVAVTEPIRLARRAVDLRLPFDQMIVYPTFVHFSHKLSGGQRGQILYNHRYTGPRL